MSFNSFFVTFCRVFGCIISRLMWFHVPPISPFPGVTPFSGVFFIRVDGFNTPPMAQSL